jgi:CDP-diacylglycerol--glycerol-3-phosphate 3-phosphatidyltransferase
LSGRAAGELAALPNLLSLSRILLAVPFAAVMLSSRPDARWWGAVIMLVGAATDKLDGMVARRYKMQTAWGRILDPLADKIAAATIVIVLLLLNVIPVWFVCAVLVRDLVIVAGGIYLNSTRQLILPSNETGKWAMGVLGAALFGLVVGAPDWLNAALMAACTLLLVLSLVFYAVRLARILQPPVAP